MASFTQISLYAFSNIYDILLTFASSLGNHIIIQFGGRMALEFLCVAHQTVAFVIHIYFY